MSEIVRAITRLNIGGPARQALLLTRALAPEYTTTLLAGRPASEEGELRDPAVSPRYVPLVRRPSPIHDARAFAAIRAVLRERRPAILHTHMAKAGSLGRIAARSLRQRPHTVHTFHGHVLEGYFRPELQRAFISVERALAARTDRLIAVSEEVRTKLLGLGIGTPDQFRVIPLGLDLRAHRQVDGHSGFLREWFGLGADVPLVGLVGRLVPIKDPATAIAAIARVPDAHLAVVGDGELRAKVEAIVERHGVADRVHFTGWQTNMPAVFADLDLVLLTSRNEGTPVALIEAGACGRACVATAVGGVPSVVEDGVTGVLTAVGAVDDLATSINALLGDPARRAAMGAAARLRAARWSEHRLVADIRSLYCELLGS